MEMTCIDGKWYARTGRRGLYIYQKLEELGVIDTINVQSGFISLMREDTNDDDGLTIDCRSRVKHSIKNSIRKWRKSIVLQGGLPCSRKVDTLVCNQDYILVSNITQSTVSAESMIQVDHHGECHISQAESRSLAGRQVEAESLAETERLVQAECPAEAERLAERLAEDERLAEAESLAEAKRLAETERQAEAERQGEAERVADAELLVKSKRQGYG